jgi:hypothetical protein
MELWAKTLETQRSRGAAVTIPDPLPPNGPWTSRWRAAWEAQTSRPRRDGRPGRPRPWNAHEPKSACLMGCHRPPGPKPCVSWPPSATSVGPWQRPDCRGRPFWRKAGPAPWRRQPLRRLRSGEQATPARLEITRLCKGPSAFKGGHRHSSCDILIWPGHSVPT